MGDDRTHNAGSSASPALDATLPADGDAGDGPREPPQSVGRYILGPPLGSGGMGMIYRARDPDLDRELAVKVVLPVIAERRAQTRLLDEARAMAKLHHPNVIPVFDVGITERGVHVVMPLLAGGTLHDWLHAEPRPWRAVVARFVAAGRGLAAAHEAGIVHRDFKPRNVLLDDKGTVVVADFGLANAVAPADAAGGANASSVVGTPAYMAPEQAAGAAVDARADQYSFCVSFWEGLHGVRPPEVPAAGDGREPPPTWLQLAIARGFSPEPEKRWPSITALLDEIEARLVAPGAADARRRRVGLAVGAVAVLGAGAFVVVGQLRRSDDRSVAGSASGAAVPDGGALDATFVVPPPRQLTHLGGCAYSPAFVDDDTVVFDLTRGEAMDLYRIETADPDAPVQLTRDPGWEWRAARGATANEVLFLSQQEERNTLDAIDLVDGKRTVIASNVEAAVFAGDAYYYALADAPLLRRRRGSRDDLLLTVDGDGSIHALAAAPESQRLAMIVQGEHSLPRLCTLDALAESPALRCVAGAEPTSARPAVSADGGAVYFQEASGVRRLDVATQEIRTALSGVRAVGGLAVSPSGHQLVYSTCGTRSRLVRVLEDSQHPYVDDDGAGYPQFGPRGLLAYVRAVGRDFAVIVREPNGTVRDLVRARNVRYSDLAFSADGRYLAFVAAAQDGGGIRVATLGANTAPNTLTDDPADSHPVFVGDDVLFTHRDKDGAPHVMRLPVAGGGEPSIAVPRPRVTVAADLQRGRVLLASPSQDFLYWWDPATGRETPGPKLGKGSVAIATLSPNGDWFLFEDQTGPVTLWRARTDAGARLEKIATLPFEESSRWAAIDDDGQPLVWIDTWVGDLWAVDAPDGGRW